MIKTPSGGIGNIGVLEGDEGIVLVDTGTGTEFARRALELIKPLTNKRVVAIIYTHHHVDHTAGAHVFVRPENAASGKVKIIAAENVVIPIPCEGNAAQGSRALVRASFFQPVSAARASHNSCRSCGDGSVPGRTWVVCGSRSSQNTPLTLAASGEAASFKYALQLTVFV